MRAALVALVLSLVLPRFTLADERVPVRLDLSAERRASALQLDELRRDFQLAFSRIECPVALVDLEKGEKREAALALGVHIERWRERNTPGGSPIFDPSTGQERKGFRREVEVRFKIVVSRPGEDEPVYEKERRVTRARGTTASIAFDPAIQARREATEWVIRESLRPLCKQAKKLLKESN